jgi:hypothetical protein
MSEGIPKNSSRKIGLLFFCSRYSQLGTRKAEWSLPLKVATLKSGATQ